MKYRYNDNMNECRDKLNKSKENLASVIGQIGDIESIANNGEWKGETQRVFIALIGLCKVYNERLVNVLESNYDEISKYIDNTESFMKNNAVITGLEGL